MKPTALILNTNLIFAAALFLAGCGGSQDQLTDADFRSQVSNASVEIASSVAEDQLQDMDGYDAANSSLSLSAEAKLKLRPHLFRRFKASDGACPKVVVSESGSTKTITKTYENCQPGKENPKSNKPTLNGQTVVSITKNAGDNEPTAFDRKVEILRQLAITRSKDPRAAKIDSKLSSETKGSFPALTKTVTLEKFNYERTNKEGKTIHNLSASGQMTFTSAGATYIESLVANGSSKIEHKLSQRVAENTYANVTWKPTCECPLEGKITHTITLADASKETKELSFNGVCGQVLVNGEVKSLEDDCDVDPELLKD